MRTEIIRTKIAEIQERDIVWDVIKNKLPELEKTFKILKEKEFD